MSNSEQSGDAAAPKKSKKKLIIIVLAAVLVIGGGAGGYLVLGSGKSSASTTKPKPTPGAVIALDAITVNLAGGHYLKIHLALQATAAAGTEIDGSQALDLTVAQFSNMNMADLASSEGRDKAKAQLLTAVAKAYEDKIMDVYFTEFVMQ